jgi:hypothetical protein
MKIIPKVKAPTFLQMAQWIINPVAFMENAARKHGDIFSTKGEHLTFVTPKSGFYVKLF